MRHRTPSAALGRVDLAARAVTALHPGRSWPVLAPSPPPAPVPAPPAPLAAGGLVVDTVVHRVRRKLGPEHGRHLVTVRRIGYRYEVPAAD
jgi:hypothetical protein